MKCYLFFDDKTRFEYVLNKYPSALSLDIFDSIFFIPSDHIKDDGNYKEYDYDKDYHNNDYKAIISRILNSKEIELIDYYLKSGISPEAIFQRLHHLAYDLAGTYRRIGNDSIYPYNYHLSFIPKHVFEQLVSAGLSLETNIDLLKYDGYMKYRVSKATIAQFFYFGNHDVKFISDPNSGTNLSSIMGFVRQTDPNVKQSSGCYVATCVYGSYDCPQVWTLRRYRDNTLASTWYGRAFIRIYYAVSPTLVKWFGHTAWFKKLWKGRLDRMVKNLQKKGTASTPYEDKQW